MKQGSNNRTLGKKFSSESYHDSAQVQWLLVCPPAPNLQIFTAVGSYKCIGICSVLQEYIVSLLERTGTGFLRSWFKKIFLFPVFLAAWRVGLSTLCYNKQVISSKPVNYGNSKNLFLNDSHFCTIFRELHLHPRSPLSLTAAFLQTLQKISK